MVSSMTGLGVGEVKFGNQIITIEIRSVNNRFLEVSSRLPSGLSSYEPAVKEIIRKSIHRGKLYVNINLQGDQNGYSQLKVATDAVSSVRQLLESLRKEAGIDAPLKLEHFLQYSEIFEPYEKIDGMDQLWKHIEEALNQAVENLCAMRNQEGASLIQDLYQRLASLESAVEKVNQIAKMNITDTHQKMVERVKNLLRDEQVDNDRLYTEIAIIADKLDITEECVRLKSHHLLFRDILENESTVGKKFNFLLQEMNREVNTISSKANNADISHLVVEMKEDIEKMREQVQNLE
ncbi:YicC/YloC family endoribonuclease [bacterium]